MNKMVLPDKQTIEILDHNKPRLKIVIAVP